MSQLDQLTITDTSENDYKEIRDDLSMPEFLKAAGFSSTPKILTLISQRLALEGITEVSQLYSYSRDQLIQIDGIKESYAKKIISQAAKIRRGSSILMSVKQMRELEAKYEYLSTPSQSLEKMLTYSNSHTGIRSSTLVELYGEASIGKTQICMTMAALCMRPKKTGGWGKGVVYIDAENAFEYSRFIYLAKYWGVSPEFIEDNLVIAKVSTFDEVEEAIEATISRIKHLKKIKETNIGMIVVDSIMDPLKGQYPVNGENLKNLQPRQAHLKKVTDQLKSMAQMYNIIALYTNHVRSSIGEQEEDGMIAQGGNVMAHASDIRIELRKLPKERSNIPIEHYSKLDQLGLSIAEATVVDCGFLPKKSGKYIVGPMGIADPAQWEIIMDHARKISQTGYICVNSLGQEIKPLLPEHAKNLKESEEKQGNLYEI